MAADGQLAELLNDTDLAVRIYNWDHPAVTLGRFQKPETALGSNCKDFAIRATGGLAVLHGHDLTISIAARLDCLPTSGNRQVRQTYFCLASIIQAAISPDGSDFAGGSSGMGPSGLNQDCFASASGFDLVDSITGKKLCGSALKLNRTWALMQTSVPLGWPLVEPSKWIASAPQAVKPPVLMSQDKIKERLKQVLQTLSENGFSSLTPE